MVEYVRVKDKQTKHEKSIPASKFDKELWERVNKDAVDLNGAPLPSKPHTSADEAAKSKTGQKAATEKENR